MIRSSRLGLFVAALALAASGAQISGAEEVPARTARAAAVDDPAPRGDEALLPASGEVTGFVREEPARVYTGPQLYELIDGGAEPFLEQGFERVTVQQYRKGGGEIGVELYAMADATAALGIYLARCGNETPAAGFAERHTAGRHELLLVRNRFYVVVADLTGRGDQPAALVAFARTLAPRLGATAPVAALDLLPAEDRVPGSERLIRGPLGLQTFIQLGEDDILQLRPDVTAAAATYDRASGRFTLVVAPYPDAARARRAFEHVLAHLDPEIQALDRTPGRLTFRDYSSQYGELRLLDTRLELRLGLEERP